MRAAVNATCLAGVSVWVGCVSAAVRQAFGGQGAGARLGLATGGQRNEPRDGGGVSACSVTCTPEGSWPNGRHSRARPGPCARRPAGGSSEPWLALGAGAARLGPSVYTVTYDQPGSRGEQAIAEKPLGGAYPRGCSSPARFLLRVPLNRLRSISFNKRCPRAGSLSGCLLCRYACARRVSDAVSGARRRVRPSSESLRSSAAPAVMRCTTLIVEDGVSRTFQTHRALRAAPALHYAPCLLRTPRRAFQKVQKVNGGRRGGGGGGGGRTRPSSSSSSSSGSSSSTFHHHHHHHHHHHE
jgi:hypothetical protein